jgi:hypothetical protein
MEVTVFGFKILSQGFGHFYGKDTWKVNTTIHPYEETNRKKKDKVNIRQMFSKLYSISF